MLNFDEGVRVLSFQKKRKNQRKVVYVFLPICYLSSDVLGWAIYGKRPHFLALFGSPRASGVCAIHVCGSR